MEISLLEELARADSYFWPQIIKGQSDYDLGELIGSISHLHDTIKDEIKSRIDKGMFTRTERVAFLFESDTVESET